MLDDQEEGLDNLSKILARQKQLAIRIGDEVEVQNGKLKMFFSTSYIDILNTSLFNAFHQKSLTIWPMAWNAPIRVLTTKRNTFDLYRIAIRELVRIG